MGLPIRIGTCMAHSPAPPIRPPHQRTASAVLTVPMVAVDQIVTLLSTWVLHYRSFCGRIPRWEGVTYFGNSKPSLRYGDITADTQI
jgi:hypothetical protein